MNKLIISAFAAGTLLAGFIGTQLAWSSESASGIATTSAQMIDNEQVSPSPVVVELFTSQGCSSCPPADRLAARLAKDSSLLVISRPVTYWDRLGWEDTLAREENTQLQRAYARKGLAGSGVYTPQMVVNGGGGAVGSREGDVRSLVRLAKTEQGPKIIAMREKSGELTVLIDGKSNYMAGVYLLALSSSETVQVGRGENGGRRLHYTNVVKDERNLGSWPGTPMSISIPTENIRIAGADKYVLILQRPGAGAIVAAKLLDI